VALILKGDKTTVQNITLTSDQTADIPLSLQTGQNAVLVVTALRTLHACLLALYWKSNNGLEYRCP